MNFKKTLHLYLAKTKGFRRLVHWLMQKRIAKFYQKEVKRCQQDPANIRNFEFKKYSQNGEDGIIEEIFKRVGTQSNFFVEFGVEDGKECNSRYLLQEKGWKGLWIDGSTSNVDKAKKEFQSYPLQVEQKFITAENIQEILVNHQVPKDLDLLSIDVDGNDYWILKALSAYRPRLLVIEYNASYLPSEKWVMPYNPDHLFDGSNYFGASLRAMAELAQSQGYSLVGCDSQGVNAFFVREELVNERFTHTGFEVDYHYCAPKYRGMFFGHPPKV